MLNMILLTFLLRTSISTIASMNVMKTRGIPVPNKITFSSVLIEFFSWMMNCFRDSMNWRKALSITSYP